MVRILIVFALLCSPLAAAETRSVLPTTPRQTNRTVSQGIEIPAVNLPLSLRQSNWLGSQGQGSCVHASFISLLRWQQRYATADWWRKTHGNGEWPNSMNQQLDAAKIRYAVTTSGDVEFLEWAIKTRRGAVVTWSPSHAVTLVHLDSKWAGILNNNTTYKITWQPRDAFIREWKSRGGWGFTCCYAPAPPLPTR